MKEEKVHVAFRSAETGRYLFWVTWTKAEWAKIELAAQYENQTVEEFIIAAIKWYCDANVAQLAGGN